MSVAASTPGSPMSSITDDETGITGPSRASVGADTLGTALVATSSASGSSHPDTIMHSSATTSGARPSVPSQTIEVPSAASSGPSTVPSAPTSNSGAMGTLASGAAVALSPNTGAAATTAVAMGQPYITSSGAGLPAVVPSTGVRSCLHCAWSTISHQNATALFQVADDPFWQCLAHAIQRYGFVSVRLQLTLAGAYSWLLQMTREGGHPERDARGLPLAEVISTGRIALSGVDRRPASDGGSILCVVDNAQLSYVPGTPTITASSVDIMQALHREARLQQGTFWVSVEFWGTLSDSINLQVIC